MVGACVNTECPRHDGAGCSVWEDAYRKALNVVVCPEYRSGASARLDGKSVVACGDAAVKSAESLATSHHKLFSFYKNALDRIDGILLNKEQYNLHPLVIKNLEAIVEMGNV